MFSLFRILAALACITLLLSCLAAQEPVEPSNQEVPQFADTIAEPADTPAKVQSSISVPLLILLITLSAASCALAFYSYRLTILRLNSEGGEKVTLDDQLRDWMSSLGQHWESSQKRYDNHADKTIAQLKGVSNKLDEQTKDNFKKLAEAFNDHHKWVDKEFAKMTKDLGEMREFLATIRQVAEDKKAELQEYKEGYRISVTRETLGHLCDVRDHLLKLKNTISSNPGDTELALSSLEDIDWELSDTLDHCDLEEIDIKPETKINDPSLSGKHKILGKLPAPNPDKVGTIAEVARHGYLIRIRREGTKEEALFRPVQVRIYGESTQSSGQQLSTTDTSTAASDPSPENTES